MIKIFISIFGNDLKMVKIDFGTNNVQFVVLIPSKKKKKSNWNRKVFVAIQFDLHTKLFYEHFLI